MTLHLHHLTGCAPAPLAYYLKALGILRIVGEQKDAAARGWWQDEHFCLLTTLDRAELERFFLEDYAPTPMFNPWGARSGFYPGSPERTARTALEKIESSSLHRVADFQAAIRKVRSAVEQSGGKKPDTDEAKFSLITCLRREVRGTGEEWLSAVMALVGEAYRAPALIGTGGNEGSGSYTSAYLNAVVSCAIDRSLDHALGLFSCSSKTQVDAIPDYSWSGSFGQFLPDGDASAWDFLFTLEGAVMFRSTVALRSDARQASPQRFLASPFYFAPHAAGSGSSAPLDEFSVNKGRRNPGRGEQWFPLWGVPARLAEIESILSEGRCSVGRRHAGRAVDAARAISRLGVARGITAFCRYGYLQRNNMATHFAVPLGRIDVRDRAYARLIDDLAPWLGFLQRLARDKHAPDRLVQAERRLADSVFAVLTHDDSAARWQSVLLAAIAVEAIQASGTKAFRAGPIPALAPEWVVAADDWSVEWRLARALGGAAGWYDREGRAYDPARHHWLPLQEGARRFQQKEKRLLRDPRVVMGGRDPVADLAALVERRLLEAEQAGQRRLPLVAAPGCEAHPADLAELVAGNVDLARVSALARALMAVRWDRWQSTQPRTAPQGTWPDEAWMALRLACLPWKLDDRAIAVDDTIVRRLIAGDGSAAVEVALRRLRAAGLRPPLQGACADPATARLWAAALAFPISFHSARAMARRFQPSNQKEIQ